jgi:hypothetical protein
MGKIRDTFFDKTGSAKKTKKLGDRQSSIDE